MNITLNKTCTFFGYGYTYIPTDIVLKLRTEIIRLITEENVNTFYIGNNGDFEEIAHHLLRKLSNRHSIKYSLVTSCLPKYKIYSEEHTSEDILLIEESENSQRQDSISLTNNWMIEHSDFVVTYGAGEFKAIAEKRGITVINISECPML